jgi:hypothetical protein
MVTEEERQTELVELLTALLDPSGTQSFANTATRSALFLAIYRIPNSCKRELISAIKKSKAALSEPPFPRLALGHRSPVKLRKPISTERCLIEKLSIKKAGTSPA